MGTAPPAVSAGAGRAALSCTRGEWAADLAGAFLYHAPRDFAFQWLLNGQEIAGATSADFTATDPGSYSCRVTATNHAGETSQTSAAYGIRSISLEARKRRVRLRQRLTLAGQVTLPGDANCLASQTVDLQRKRPDDSGFTTFATVETDSAGEFRFKRLIKQPPRRFRALLPATASCAAAKSLTDQRAQAARALSAGRPAPARFTQPRAGRLPFLSRNVRNRRICRRAPMPRSADRGFGEARVPRL